MLSPSTVASKWPLASTVQFVDSKAESGTGKSGSVVYLWWKSSTNGSPLTLRLRFFPWTTETMASM
jgi:hypothetical protein